MKFPLSPRVPPFARLAPGPRRLAALGAFFFERSAAVAKPNLLLLVTLGFCERGAHPTYPKGVDRRRPARWCTGAHTRSTAKQTRAAPRPAAGAVA